MTTYFEMRNGSKNNYYTLWKIVSNERFYNEVYLRNLSVNYDEAFEKAEVYAKKAGMDFFDGSRDNTPILYGSDVLRFGKYYGKRVNSLEDDGYLIWLAMKCDNLDPELKAAAKARCLELGLLAYYGSELLPVILINYLNNKAKMQGHHFTNGEKVKNLICTVLGVRSFQVCYGYQSSLCFIIEFKTCDDKIVIYKGSKIYYDTKMPNGVYFDQVFGIDGGLKKGNEVILSGTIEHGNYRETNQTYIQRPKFNITEEMQSKIDLYVSQFNHAEVI